MQFEMPDNFRSLIHLRSIQLMFVGSLDTSVRERGGIDLGICIVVSNYPDY